MMSTTMKSPIFLAIAFAVTWAIVIAGWSAGLHEQSPQTAVMLLAVSMIGPTVAALICAVAFEKGQRLKSLGLSWRWTWWWMAAWIAPIAIAVVSVAITLSLSDRTYVDIGAGVLMMFSQEQLRSRSRARPRKPAPATPDSRIG